MAEHDFERAFGYANAALAIAERGQVPPFPQFYELLYTYATGVNPGLNTRINAVLLDAGLPGVDIAERLYNEFIKSNDVAERISHVSERMSARIDAVNDAIGTAMVTADAYAGSLQTANGLLAEDLKAVELKALTVRLLAETRRMQEVNGRLENQLEASRGDIAALQRGLDEVRRESMLDPLTKILNRKSFDEGLIKAITDCNFTGEPMSLLLIDIDHFKRFNDNYGHQTGDQVLRLVAATIKSNIKGKDLAARYGGEEFGAILPSTGLADAISVAETIRKAVQAKELLKRSTNEKLGRITTSIGVATCVPGDTASTLIERADRCLYAAKAAGRNCVVAEGEPAGMGFVAA